MMSQSPDDQYYPVHILIGTLLISGGTLLWYWQRESTLLGAVIALIGCYFVWRACAFSTFNLPALTRTRTATPQRSAQTTAILFVISIAIGLLTAWLGKSDGQPILLLLTLWILSYALCFAAFLPIAAVSTWFSYLQRINRSELIAVIVLLTSAIVLRTIDLNGLPNIMQEDEAHFALRSLQIMTVHDWRISPFRYEETGHPLLFHYLQALGMLIGGTTMAGARLISALIGALAIPGLYLAARLLFNRRIAFLGALILLCLSVHLHFSRLAFNVIVDATTAIWSLALLILALRTDHPVNFALAGSILGLSQFGYSSSRLIPVLLLLFVLLLWLSNNRKSIGSRRSWLTFAAMFLIVALPHFLNLALHQESLSPRLPDTLVWLNHDPVYGMPSTFPDALGFWLNQLSRSIFAYIQIPDAAYFYASSDPFAGWFGAVPFIIGFVITVQQYRDPRFGILILWVLITTVLGSVILIIPPQYQRLVVAAPIVSILIAIGITALADALAAISRAATPDYPMPLAFERIGIPLALCSLICISELLGYFWTYRLAEPYFRDNRTRMVNELADRVIPALTGYEIWLLVSPSTDLSQSPVINFKNPTAHLIPYHGAIESLLTELPGNTSQQAIIIPPDDPAFDSIVAILSQQPTFTHLPTTRETEQFERSAAVFVWNH
ncbi:MAG: glycosyltransferase family 39 protein [Anaerolineae bacterium]